MAAPSVHANCVVVGEAGVLIRGASGSGKSALSATLIARAQGAGLFAGLVADDRTLLTVHHGRVIASPPPAIAGLMERRGAGIVTVDWVPEAVVRLVVDIEPQPARMPQDGELSVTIEGVALPRLAIAQGSPDAADLALSRLESGRRSVGCCSMALAFATQHEKIASSASQAPAIQSNRAGTARGGHLPGAQ